MKPLAVSEGVGSGCIGSARVSSAGFEFKNMQ